LVRAWRIDPEGRFEPVRAWRIDPEGRFGVLGSMAARPRGWDGRPRTSSMGHRVPGGRPPALGRVGALLGRGGPGAAGGRRARVDGLDGPQARPTHTAPRVSPSPP